MNYILYDDAARPRLLPFTHTRPVADIRCGIFTMRERWEYCLQQQTSSATEPYLQKVYPLTTASDNLYINASVFGNPALVNAISTLQPGNTLAKGNLIIAAHLGSNDMAVRELNSHIAGMPAQLYEGEVYALSKVWDIFSLNGKAIEDDFAMLTRGRESAPIPAHVTVTGADRLFIEEGANVYAGCVINASTGPVYIAKGVEMLEGTLVRGPLAVLDHGVIKMGAKIYGATTIGPGCKVGGEINNAVFFANSNKAHDGYLGNAVIGEWCNLGADTNCSNLKNNYMPIKIWDEAANRSVHTGLTFCGLLMGDHSKAGINTMFNTGTVVGVSCNVYGSDYPDRFIRSFSWGGSGKFTLYNFDRAMETAARMMERRGRTLSADELEMFRYIYDNSRPQQEGLII